MYQRRDPKEKLYKRAKRLYDHVSTEQHRARYQRYVFRYRAMRRKWEELYGEFPPELIHDHIPYLAEGHQGRTPQVGTMEDTYKATKLQRTRREGKEPAPTKWAACVKDHEGSPIMSPAFDNEHEALECYENHK